MGHTGDAYDVFFSYHGPDRAAVEGVAQALRRQGLKVFLDRWYLAPGRPWPQALEEVLASCRAVAVFLGPAGLGPWQQREKNLALSRQARQPEFLVIPVLLPGADPALDFLSQNTWVDLRSKLDDPLSLEILQAAIRGEPPGPDLTARVRATLAAVCPYRGLRPFREEDAPFFFGREACVDRLAEVSKLARYLQQGDLALGQVVAGALAKQPGTDRLLLLVDQWEELTPAPGRKSSGAASWRKFSRPPRTRP